VEAIDWVETGRRKKQVEGVEEQSGAAKTKGPKGHLEKGKKPKKKTKGMWPD